MKTSKGQFSSLDAMLAIGGLLLIITLSLATFAAMYEKMSASVARKDMELRAYYAFGQLLSPGNPPNWQEAAPGAATNFGLEAENSVLDSGKLDAFNSTMASNYSLARDRLGLSAYNFSVTVSNYYNSSRMYLMGATNPSDSVTMSYVSTLNGSLVLVRMMVSR